MKCSKCGYFGPDYLTTCKKCGKDLSEEKEKLGFIASLSFSPRKSSKKNMIHETSEINPHGQDKTNMSDDRTEAMNPLETIPLPTMEQSDATIPLPSDQTTIGVNAIEEFEDLQSLNDITSFETINKSSDTINENFQLETDQADVTVSFGANQEMQEINEVEERGENTGGTLSSTDVLPESERLELTGNDTFDEKSSSENVDNSNWLQSPQESIETPIDHDKASIAATQTKIPGQKDNISQSKDAEFYSGISESASQENKQTEENETELLDNEEISRILESEFFEPDEDTKTGNPQKSGITASLDEVDVSKIISEIEEQFSESNKNSLSSS